MVAEILAGIALAKSAVSGIKSAIETAKDVNDVAHHLDDLLTGYDQSKRKTQKKKPKGNKAWTRYLGSKLKDQDDDISLSQITSEVIEQKQIEEQIQSIKRMMNKRFGPGTWDEILKLRQERIDERKKEIKDFIDYLTEYIDKHMFTMFKSLKTEKYQMLSMYFLNAEKI